MLIFTRYLAVKAPSVRVGAISETVVSNGPSREIAEAASEVTSGDPNALSYTLELTPNE